MIMMTKVLLVVLFQINCLATMTSWNSMVNQHWLLLIGTCDYVQAKLVVQAVKYLNQRAANKDEKDSKLAFLVKG